MALLEDVLKGNALVLVAAGAATLVLPKVISGLPGPFDRRSKGGCR